MNQKLKTIAAFFVQMDEPIGTTGSKTATAIPADVLEELKKHYETVFTGANLPGVDFFEFYALIAKQPKADQGAYVMALDMVRTMNSEATVATLSENAAFYLQKIEEAAASYVQQQGEEKNRLEQQVASEKSALTGQAESARQEITKLEQALALEREKLSAAEKGLGEIDARFAPSFAQVDTNLAANEQAKGNMIARITTVITNLKKFVTAGSVTSTHY